MLTLISPSKSLDFDSIPATRSHTLPEFLDHSEQLVTLMRKRSPNRLKKMMGISANLAQLNWQRYQDWHRPFDQTNSRQAILAFKGDVYLGLKAEDYTRQDFSFAQKHLRILSGLYGILRPLDLMQAYRLEMGSSVANSRGKDLYHFWGQEITAKINEELSGQRSKSLVNLASNEYFKSVNSPEVNGALVTPQFKDFSNGSYRVLSFFAKKARGAMASYIVKNRVDRPEGIKDFDVDGYGFNQSLSDDQRWVFTRKNAQ